MVGDATVSLRSEILESPGTPRPPSRHVGSDRQRRAWQCHTCNQAFKKREHLVRHVRSHTKEKPFSCEVCAKAYSRRDSLIRHARSHSRGGEATAAASGHSIPSPPDLEAGASGLPSNSEPPISDQPNHIAHLDLGQVDGYDAPDYLVQDVTHMNGDLNATQVSPLTHSSTCSGYAPASSDGLQTADPGEIPLDPDLFSFDMSAHDPFWLLGAHFNIDALNSSISAAASPRPNDGLPMDLSAEKGGMSSKADDENGANSMQRRVQARWHTRPTIDSSHPYAPTRLQDQDQVDDAYREGLSNRLAPRPHDDSLPSADFLNLCIKLYFCKFQPIFPIVHAATFRPSSESALLLLSICSLGALFVGSARASSRGRAIFIRLNKAILASWEVYLYKGGREALSVAQAAALGQTYGMLSGNPNDLLMTESFHGTIIAWARQAGMFQPKNSLSGINLESPANAERLETQWRSWAHVEETVRVVTALRIHDSEFATLLHREPLLRHEPGRAPRCCPERLFSATTAAHWHATMSSIKPLTLHGRDDDPTLTTGPGTGSKALMHGYSLIAGLCASICEARSQSFDVVTREDFRYQLTSWYEMHAATIRNPARDTLCLMVLWHQAFMSLNVSFDLLERIIGRDGPSTSDEDITAIRNWVNEAEGERCVLHAMLICKRLQALPFSAEPAIHVPKALFYAGLVIYFHVKLRAADACYDDVDAPELSLGSASDIAGASLISTQRLDLGMLHAVADVLRRQGHWEVARRFASILEALIDDITDTDTVGMGQY